MSRIKMWKKRMILNREEKTNTMKRLKKHLETKLKDAQMEGKIVVDIVEFKETFDPRKVWLYEQIDEDYNPFTMNSVQQRVLVLKEPQKFPERLWKKGPHYDEKTDTWFMTEESFKVDSMKLFEYKEYAECSVRLYENDSLTPASLKNWSAWDLPSKMFYALPIDDQRTELSLYPCRFLHEMRLKLSRVFWDEPKPEEKENIYNRWLEHECASFMLKERLCYTTTRTGVVLICAFVQGLLAWKSTNISSQSWKSAICSGMWTCVAGWASLWLYDCCQRNKQKLNIPDDKIKIMAGGSQRRPNSRPANSAILEAAEDNPDYTVTDRNKEFNDAKSYELGGDGSNGCILPTGIMILHPVQFLPSFICAACQMSCTLGICQPCEGDGSAESHVTMVGVVIHRELYLYLPLSSPAASLNLTGALFFTRVRNS
ncbi:hypothetical protein EMCRGX_G016509 [Ephydatia muelleri]